MDYSYFAPAAQPYPFFTLPEKPGHPYTSQEETHHDPLEAYNDPSAFQFFDQNAQFGAPPIIPPPPQTPPHSLHRPSITNLMAYERSGSMSNDINGEAEYEQAQGRSSDDDKDNLTPAQSRRKAQNRAAQRAFRERKERRVKDLELKLASIEARSTDLLSDNERLKRENDRLATQNEILRATTTTTTTTSHPAYPATNPNSNDASSNGCDDLDGQHPDMMAPHTTSLVTYDDAAFNQALHSAYPGPNPGPDAEISHRVTSSASGERLLSTGAAWDLIQSHELVRRGLVDLPEVVDRLRERVECDGAGPTVAEGEVVRAVEESAAGVGGDELI